jgi:hypothetical protein
VDAAAARLVVVRFVAVRKPAPMRHTHKAVWALLPVTVTD